MEGCFDKFCTIAHSENDKHHFERIQWTSIKPVLETDAFHLQTDRSDRLVQKKGKRPRIYLLGEKSRVTEGHELPGGFGGKLREFFLLGGGGGGGSFYISNSLVRALQRSGILTNQKQRQSSRAFPVLDTSCTSSRVCNGLACSLVATLNSKS